MREKVGFIKKGVSAEIAREGFTLNKHGITSWLIAKNIISAKEKVISYSDIVSWFRSGSESYVSVFEFSTANETKKILIKALITMFPKKSLLDWARRRKILSENNISVSNWYFVSEATIYEDFYPFTAKEKVAFETLLNIGYKLDSLGFTTLKFIDDIRADKNGNPYFIDFGFDLGEPAENKTTSAKEYLAKAFPDKVLEINNYYDNKD